MLDFLNFVIRMMKPCIVGLGICNGFLLMVLATFSIIRWYARQLGWVDVEAPEKRKGLSCTLLGEKLTKQLKRGWRRWKEEKYGNTIIR